MDNLKKLIQEGTDTLHKKIVEIRRHLHANPELSFQEVNTSSYIQSILKEHQVKYSTGHAGTGVLAQIGPTNNGPCLVLRADIDALPIQEKNKKPYTSKKPGIMHACGHDVHTACALGATILLKSLEQHLDRGILVIFQPGEEKLPGGASILLEEGVFDNFDTKAIIALHVHPPLEVGHVGLRSGMYMASADEIYMSIKGKGGHGALPHQCIDPIVVSSEIILGLQKVASRLSPPTVPTVLTIGKINSIGGATNIIPDEVKLQGTFRTMNEEWRKEAHLHINNIATSIARSYGAHVDVDIRVGYPFLKNHELLTKESTKILEKFMGKDKVVELPIRMTAEDFSYYTHRMPGCFFRLGTGNKGKGIITPVHTATFDIDEEALLHGTRALIYLAMNIKIDSY